MATHADPDADALVSAWLAERFLFPGEPTRVAFVGYDHDWAAGPAVDCVLDLGGVYASELHAFDHKPPAFADRNATCTARLLWEHLRGRGLPVWHLEHLVDVVREADRMPRRGRGSDALRASQRDGLLARVKAARAAGGATSNATAGCGGGSTACIDRRARDVRRPGGRGGRAAVYLRPVPAFAVLRNTSPACG